MPDPEPTSSTERRPRRAGLTLLAGALVAQPLDLLAVGVAAHLLGLAGFGAFVAARAVAGALAQIVSVRSSEALLAFWPAARRERGAAQAAGLVGLAVWFELGALVVTCALAAALGALWPSFVPDSGATPVAAAAILALAALRPASAGLVAVAHAGLRLDDRFVRSAAHDVLPAALRLAGFVICWLSGASLVELVAVDGLAALIGGAAAVAAIRRVDGAAVPWSIPRALWRSERAELLRFARTNWLASTVRAGATYGAELVLLGASTAAALGAFGLARRLAGALAVCIGPLVAAATPRIHVLAAADDRRSLRALVTRSGTEWLLVSLGLGAALWLGAGPVLGLLGGAEFRAAQAPLSILLLAFSLHFATAWLKPLMLARRRTERVLLAQATMAVALLGGGALLVPATGATGAAAAVLLGYLAQIATYLPAGLALLRPDEPGVELGEDLG